MSSDALLDIRQYSWQEEASGTDPVIVTSIPHLAAQARLAEATVGTLLPQLQAAGEIIRRKLPPIMLEETLILTVRPAYQPAVPDEPGWVYLAQADDLYKVGMSADPDQRQRGLVPPNRRPVKVIHRIETSSMFRAETLGHRIFQPRRHQVREWYWLTPSDVAWLGQIQELSPRYVRGAV